MADSFFDKFGLGPGAGSDAAAFAENMDKSAAAAQKFRLESDLGYKTLTKTIDGSKKLIDDAKLNQKLLEKKNFDQKSLVLQLRKEGASQDKIAKAVAAAKESRDAIRVLILKKLQKPQKLYMNLRKVLQRSQKKM